MTLAANGAGNHFNVQAGAHLTLTQITLSNGLNTRGCGGAVKVLAGGQLTLNETRFINNTVQCAGRRDVQLGHGRDRGHALHEQQLG